MELSIIAKAFICFIVPYLILGLYGLWHMTILKQDWNKKFESLLIKYPIIFRLEIVLWYPVMMSKKLLGTMRK